jgi:hypothetical protein
VISPGEGFKVLVRVQGWLGSLAGRVIYKILSHNILGCTILVPFEGRSGPGCYAVAAERKRHRPQKFTAVNNKVYCLKTGKGERVARNYQ